ncbi:hypothetical protein AURDEDRAFT_115684 [Auricularia subglabra TFB-10046 SS5]|uniref:F-box domain-containing protein n=1 Tax=Auricularia subglabra (strain TFB-10046 / SS5) TaxID=717982 RepID=J0WYJ0_AURST|nr:hypothetical protein AURDEDRAFT_115684 [Auricularia subglabra TFB-10046 SS5]
MTTVALPRELELAFEELAAKFAEEVQKECKTQAELAKATADMIDCVSGYVGYEMSLAAREMNRTSPLLSVNPPPDVFGHVCDYLTLAERIMVTGVCHYWRKLAIADARLWNHIVQSYPDSTGARELLERSRNTPVHLELTIYEQNVDAVGVFLTEHLGHIKTLILRMAESRSGKGNTNAWNIVNYALSRPAPVLEVLYINMQRSAYNPVGSEEACTLRPDFLAGDAPMLREVSLSGVLPPSNTAEPIQPFGFVDTLMYTHSNGQALTGTELNVLVENFPRIHTFGLSAQQYTDNGLSLKKLPNLRIVDSVLGQGGEAALRRLNYEHVALVCVRQNFHHHDVMPVLRNERSRVEALSVTMTDMSMTARDEDNQPQERRFFGLSADQLAGTLIDADNFRHLGTLTLHEFMWPNSGTLPAAPLLRRLTVLLATTVEHRTWGAGNAHAPMMMPNLGGQFGHDEPSGKLTLFQLPAELPAPWNCGSLRELTLAFGGAAWAKPGPSDAESAPRVVAASDVLAFVQTHLATALPLGRIELRGVEFLEAAHEVPAFHGLLANCTEFVVGPPGADPAPQSTGLWETFYNRARSHDRRRRVH